MVLPCRFCFFCHNPRRAANCSLAHWRGSAPKASLGGSWHKKRLFGTGWGQWCIHDHRPFSPELPAAHDANLVYINTFQKELHRSFHRGYPHSPQVFPQHKTGKVLKTRGFFRIGIKNSTGIHNPVEFFQFTELHFNTGSGQRKPAPMLRFPRSSGVRPPADICPPGSPSAVPAAVPPGLR